MTDRFSEFYDDLIAYVDFARANNRPSAEIASTLIHDISGWTRGDKCFSPRVTGYSKHGREKGISL